MIFKIYDCDFGFTLNDVNYDFTHVQSLQIEDPETTNLIRGSNAGNKQGIVYKEGTRDPKVFTVTILGMPASVHELLKGAYNQRTRMDAYCISRVDGSGKIAKNAVLSQEPQQLAVDDSAESLNVSLRFVSFDVSETHKSD